MKIDSKRKKFFLFELPWISARHAFFSCLVIFLASVLIGVAIFFKNYFEIESKGARVAEEKIYFNEKARNQLIELWGENEKKFNEANTKTYLNPFVLTEEKK